MDRLVLRTLRDFWILVEEHRGELALRDLGLRRQREPHLSTAFVVVARLGLVPRWPGPAAMIDALRRRTRALSWSTRELADKLGISVRSAERLLAADHTHAFTVAIRWADVTDLPFTVAHHVQPTIDRREAPSSTDRVIASPTEPAIDGDRSGPHPSAATDPAEAGDSSVPGPEAATEPAEAGDTTVPCPPAATNPANSDDNSGQDSDPTAAEATTPATPADTSGPRPAQLVPVSTEAATTADTTGHDLSARSNDAAAPDDRNMSHETCPSDPDSLGHPGEEEPAGGPRRDVPRSPTSDTSGPRSPATRASTPQRDRPDNAERIQALQSPAGGLQAEPMMATVEWRRDGEVIFRGEVARDEVRQTLKALSRLPRYAGAVAWVDGKPYRKKRRRHNEDLGAVIGAAIANNLQPLIHGQRVLEERQAAFEHRLNAAQDLTEGLKDLKTLFVPTRPPSFLGALTRALLEEIAPKEESK